MKKFELPVGTHRIEYATVDPILVSLDGVPQTVIRGKGKAVIKGGGTLELDVTSKKKFRFDVTSKESRHKEVLDDLPPPQPPRRDNFLAMIRHKVRMEMGITRENFAERLSPYELRTDDGFLFEEEFQQLHEKKQESESETGSSGDDGAPAAPAADGEGDGASDQKPKGENKE